MTRHPGDQEGRRWWIDRLWERLESAREEHRWLDGLCDVASLFVSILTLLAAVGVFMLLIGWLDSCSYDDATEEDAFHDPRAGLRMPGELEEAIWYYGRLELWRRNEWPRPFTPPEDVERFEEIHDRPLEEWP